jgi:hypothetical protein
VVCLLAGLVGIYAYAGLYGLNLVWRHGGAFWVNVAPDDHRLSASMRLALEQDPQSASAAGFDWRALMPGFEVAEMPVIAADRQVDRIQLARIDPTRFRFIVRTAPAGDVNLRQWMQLLHATLVINGPYYGQRGEPATPLIAEGVEQGPETYPAGHGGAFVVTDSEATMADLAHQDWQSLFLGAKDAIASHPLLVGEAAPSHPIAPSRWLANRSFIGEDREGRILLGTTKDAFFSLARLAAFLKAAPLDLKLAMNLDGGPVACQAIATAHFQRDECGSYELREEGGQLKLLTIPYGRPDLPVALAVIPR